MKAQIIIIKVNVFVKSEVLLLDTKALKHTLICVKLKVDWEIIIKL